MEIIKYEKVKFSKKEYEAFEMVEKCLDGLLREAHHPKLCSLVSSILDNLYELDFDFIEANTAEEEVEEPTEEEYCWEKEYCEDEEVIEEVEEPTEEHCWDERHIPSQFELNP